jgi:hypothetical protein
VPIKTRLALELAEPRVGPFLLSPALAIITGGSSKAALAGNDRSFCPASKRKIERPLAIPPAVLALSFRTRLRVLAPQADRWVGGEAELTDLELPRKRRPIHAEDGREIAGRSGERARPRS